MASSVIQAFPRRPIAPALTKEQANRRRLWLLAVIAIFLVAAYFGFRDWQRAALRDDLRARGVEAEVLEAEGSCLSRRQISGDQNLGCTYTIQYRLRPEHGGEVRSAEARLSERFLVFAPPALYDPADPSRVMFKPEVERAPDHVSGTITWAVLILVPAAALLLWLATGRRALAAAARDPKPTVVAIDRAVRRTPSNQLEIWFERPEGGAPILNVFREGNGPLLVPPPADAPADRDYALALLTPKGRPILLDDRLAMVALSDEERAAVLQAARG